MIKRKEIEMGQELGKNKKGLTLVEILLVVIIIGILAAMVMPNLAGRSEEARRAAAQADIEANLAMALDMYEMDNGRYPLSEQGLGALLAKPEIGPAANWKGPYLKKRRLPRDPWGREYRYLSPGAHNKEEYDLSSLGSDGEESEDDICNWEKPF